jgi:hypothetical protein
MNTLSIDVIGTDSLCLMHSRSSKYSCTVQSAFLLLVIAVATPLLMFSIVKAVIFHRWLKCGLKFWCVECRKQSTYLNPRAIWSESVSMSESPDAESGWMIWDLRSTWHPAGPVIAAEDWIVIDLKDLGHLMVGEKSEGEEKIHLLLTIEKSLFWGGIRSNT